MLLLGEMLKQAVNKKPAVAIEFAEPLDNVQFNHVMGLLRQIEAVGAKAPAMGRAILPDL